MYSSLHVCKYIYVMLLKFTHLAIVFHSLSLESPKKKNSLTFILKIFFFFLYYRFFFLIFFFYFSHAQKTTHTQKFELLLFPFFFFTCFLVFIFILFFFCSFPNPSVCSLARQDYSDIANIYLRKICYA